MHRFEVFRMAEKRKHLSDDIKKVIVEMRESGHKPQQIASTLGIPRGTVSDVYYCSFSAQGNSISS